MALLDALTREDMRELIDALPEQERDAIEAVFYEQVSYGELAQRWGSSRTQAWKVTHRAMARIKLALLRDDE